MKELTPTKDKTETNNPFFPTHENLPCNISSEFFLGNYFIKHNKSLGDVIKTPWECGRIWIIYASQSNNKELSSANDKDITAIILYSFSSIAVSLCDIFVNLVVYGIPFQGYNLAVSFKFH